MSGNTFGVLFKVTTFGESHGKALGAIIDGCPPNLDLGGADIQAELDRRKPVAHKASTSRKEEDRVEVLSGIFEGKTTGTPIALLIRNLDADSGAYEELRDVFRPGRIQQGRCASLGTPSWDHQHECPDSGQRWGRHRSLRSCGRSDHDHPCGRDGGAGSLLPVL